MEKASLHPVLRHLFGVRPVTVPSGSLPAERADGLRHLLVDVSVIHQHDARTGIQRVVRALLLQLLGDPISNFEVRPVFATKDHGYRYADPRFLERRSGSGGALSDKLVEAHGGDVFLGLDLAANLLPRHREQVERWRRNGATVQILVYDLLPLLHPQWFHRRTTAHFRRWLDFIVHCADGVICISDQVAQDFYRLIAARHSGVTPNIRISRIRLSGDIRGSAPSMGLPDGWHEMSRSWGDHSLILMVGTVEPRKGYDRALAAFTLLWRTCPESTLRLVIVGKAGWKTESLQKLLRRHPEAGKRLFWIEDASDEAVELLYERASGVLVTSYAEGYGLPLSEACAHGKPVLARDLAVFRELGHPSISFFRDDTAAALEAAILDWVRLFEEQPNPVAAQPLPNWRIVGQDLLAALTLDGPADVGPWSATTGDPGAKALQAAATDRREQF